LEALRINMHGFGWDTCGGITPNGLPRLLQTYRSLCLISVAIRVDTRRYTSA
ncbi:hypothetical protein EV363DRAFT_1077367, partial [Boletus edulis]